MKNLLYVRHGRKEGENITEEQILEIEQNGIKMLNELVKGQNLVMHEGTGLDRTRQTIAAFSWYLKQNPEEGCLITKWLPVDYRLGNDTMFKRFLASDVISEEAKRTDWWHAFVKYDVNFLIEIQAELMQAIKNLFALAADDCTIVSVGHTPLIEWAAYAFDRQGRQANISRHIKLAELTGFIFTEDHGRICVTGTIGF